MTGKRRRRDQIFSGKRGCKARHITKGKRGKDKRTHLLKLLVLLLATVLIGIAIGSVMFSRTFIIEKKDINVDLQVSDKLAFNLNQDALHLGTTIPKGEAVRKFSIKPERDSYIIISAEGDLSEWLSTDSNRFFLSTGEIKDVEITASVPANASFGNYSAVLHILFYNPKYFS